MSSKNLFDYGSSKKKTLTFTTVDDLMKQSNQLVLSPSERRIINSKQELKYFFERSIREHVEGIMLKNLHAHYQFGKKVGAMFKLKQLQDDLDLVITGAEYGTGKRGGALSSFYVSVYDTEKETFLEIGKVASGIKDKSEEGVSLEVLNKHLEPLIERFEDNRAFITPQIILQVRYQDIQASTKYPAQYALRFPRMIIIREDKPLSEITTLQDIKKLLAGNKE